MKKVFSIIALTILVWSCSKKMTPAKTETASSNSGNISSVSDKPSSTNVINTPSTTTTSGTATTTTNPTSAAKPVEKTGTGADEAAMAGQSTFNAKCNRCHGYKVVSDYTVDRWISIMQVMAMKANLSETEKENVLAYVKTNAKKG